MVSPERARSRLVAALRRGSRVRSAAVAEAFAAVPRHLFLPGTPIDEAYADEAVATKFDAGVAVSSASQPSMMAIMLEQLDVRPGHRVLEIGAGTGYNAALIARLVGPTGSVTAIDIDAELISQAEDNLLAAGVTGVELLVGDGALGHPAGAPYDRIILTVGSWDVRPEWIAQLAPGGRLLLPLAVRGSQLSVGLDLGPDGVLRSDSVRSCAFIRLRGVGAGPEASTPLSDDGLAVQVAENARTDPDALRTLLDDPGPTRPVGVWVGPADLWDGLGLWLAVSEPRVCRLLATGDSARGELARTLIEVGPDRGTVALGAGSRPLGRFGLAALVRHPPDAEAGPDGLYPTGVQAFGPAGEELAAQLAALVDDWTTMGRPTAGEIALVVVPNGVTAPATGWPGPAIVDKQHCRLLVSWWPSPV